jgi:hypothetical protein
MFIDEPSPRRPGFALLALALVLLAPAAAPAQKIVSVQQVGDNLVFRYTLPSDIAYWSYYQVRWEGPGHPEAQEGPFRRGFTDDDGMYSYTIRHVKRNSTYTFKVQALHKNGGLFGGSKGTDWAEKTFLTANRPPVYAAASIVNNTAVTLTIYFSTDGKTSTGISLAPKKRHLISFRIHPKPGERPQPTVSIASGRLPTEKPWPTVPAAVTRLPGFDTSRAYAAVKEADGKIAIRPLR